MNESAETGAADADFPIVSTTRIRDRFVVTCLHCEILRPLRSSSSNYMEILCIVVGATAGVCARLCPLRSPCVHGGNGIAGIVEVLSWKERRGGYFAATGDLVSPTKNRTPLMLFCLVTTRASLDRLE